MKKEVMTRAWKIYRTLTGDRQAKLSMALSQSWNEVKAPKKVNFQEEIEKLGHTNIVIQEWEKDGDVRLYIKEKKNGYVGLYQHGYAKLNTKEIYSRKNHSDIRYIIEDLQQAGVLEVGKYTSISMR